MKEELQEISVRDLSLNPIERISDDWLLITAGTKEHGFNTMTACWGQTGAVWGHGKGLPAATVYIHPQRYTKQFIDQNAYYTLSFFPKAYKKQLAYIGTHSGREEDKVAKTGLTPVFDERTTWFAEADLVLICRKLYRQTLREDCFIDRSVMEDNYPNRDFHDMYIGVIVSVLKRLP